MKTLNCLIVLLSAALFFGCTGNDDAKNPTDLNAKVSGEDQGSKVHTTLNFEYLRKSDSNPVQVRDEQDFTFKQIADSQMLKRRFAVVTSYDPNSSYPVGMGITNVWAKLENESTPRVDLNFFFKSKQIELGKTYQCTSSDNSECKFDLSTARYHMDITTKDVGCILKVESEVNLDFSVSEPKMGWRGISFPSSLEQAPLEGKPFAISVVCTSESNEIINGYFQHNSSVIPKL